MIINNNLEFVIKYKYIKKDFYIPWDSNHPFHIKKNIITSMARRAMLLCSNNKLFILAKYALIVRFQMSGYPLKTLQKYMNKIEYKNRNKILKNLNKNRNGKINEILTLTALPYKKDWINPYFSNIIQVPYDSAIPKDNYKKLINHYKKSYPNKMIVYNVNDSIFATIRKYCAIDE